MTRRRTLAQLSIVVAVVLAATSVSAQTVGYTARASGFDLNFDGIVGEAGSGDLNVCDGQGDQSLTTGEDLDGNGVFDRQVYVDLTNGSDSLTCGLPGSPCHTISYAMNGSNTNVAGGPIQAPAAAQIQAICFKGIGRETVVPTQPGASGTFTLPQTGHQARSFRLPRYPFILSGWDTNNNDQYPPFDTADTAVLDGTLGGQVSLTEAIVNSNHLSNLEFAHFTARNYGQNIADDLGFMKVAQGGGTASQIYIHDLELDDIMKGMTNANTSGHIVFSFFTASTVLNDVALVNLNISNAGGGYFVRGAGTNDIDILGPYRFQNISLTLFGAADDSVNGIKLWSTINGIEVIDNMFDDNPRAWLPHAVGGTGGYAVGVSYCSSDWAIRGNSFVDFKQFVIVSPYYGSPGGCEIRLTDAIVIDRNTIRNTYDPWALGDDGIELMAGKDNVDTIGSVTITNNFLSSSTGWQACIWSDVGNPVGPQTGTITIAGNTCYGVINRFAALVVGEVQGAQYAFPQQSYVIKDNIVAATQGGGPNIQTYYGVTGLSIDGNAYDPQANFVWNNAGTSLSGWQTSASGDLNSKQCAPAFVNASTGNFRLSPSDTCAKAAGVSIASITTLDIDGDLRSATNPSIGAYELGGVKPPAAPTNIRIIKP